MRLFPRSARYRALKYRPRRSRLADTWVMWEKLGHVERAMKALRVLPLLFITGVMGAVFAGNIQGAWWLLLAAFASILMGALIQGVARPLLLPRSPLSAIPFATSEALGFADQDSEIRSLVGRWLETTQSPALTPREEDLIIRWGVEKGLDEPTARSRYGTFPDSHEALRMDEEFFLDFPDAPRLPEDRPHLCSNYRRCILVIESAMKQPGRL